MQVEQSIPDSGIRGSNKEEENTFGQMGLDIQASGMAMWWMEKGCLLIGMGLNGQASL